MIRGDMLSYDVVEQAAAEGRMATPSPLDLKCRSLKLRGVTATSIRTAT
jgi:hypothetical protein